MWTWKEMKKSLMKWKKSFDNPCFFWSCTLLSHLASLLCVCVHQSHTITQQSFPLSHLYHSYILLHRLPLPPAFILSMSDCAPAVLYLAFPLHHAWKNDKVTSLTTGGYNSSETETDTALQILYCDEWRWNCKKTTAAGAVCWALLT